MYDDSAEIEFVMNHSQRKPECLRSEVCNLCKYINKHIVKERFILYLPFRRRVDRRRTPDKVDVLAWDLVNQVSIGTQSSI